MTRAIVRLLAWAGFLALLAGTRFFIRAPHRTRQSRSLYLQRYTAGRCSRSPAASASFRRFRWAATRCAVEQYNAPPGRGDANRFPHHRQTAEPPPMLRCRAEYERGLSMPRSVHR